MRLLIQRCTEAKVCVRDHSGASTIVGQIGYGMVVLIGLGQDDNIERGTKLIDKLLKYRLFDDEQGKMGRNIVQVNGAILLVSQFTLYAQTHKGLRPDFSAAMPPAAAAQLYHQLLDYLKSQYPYVASGIFAADMQVHLVNDGPVTFLLENEL